MNEQDAVELLDRLGEGFPDRMPPPGGLLAAGRAARRRRTTRSVVAAAVAVVLVVGGGSLAVGLTRAVDGQASPVDSVRPIGPDIPQPPAGTQWAGRGRVVVAVPAAWAARAVGDGVTSVGFEHSNDAVDQVVFYPAAQRRAASISIHPTADVDDEPAQQSNVVCQPFGCFQSVLMPSMDVYLEVRTLGRRQLAVVRDSLRVLPPGLVFLDGSIVPTPTPVVSRQQLLGQWRPVRIGGRALTADQTPDGGLGFTNDAVSVSADGCGGGVGSWSVDVRGVFGVHFTGFYEAYCAGPYFPLLGPQPGLVKQATRAELDHDGRLVLRDADGTELAAYARVASPEPTVVTSSEQIVGSWVPVRFSGRELGPHDDPAIGLTVTPGSMAVVTDECGGRAGPWRVSAAGELIVQLGPGSSDCFVSNYAWLGEQAELLMRASRAELGADGHLVLRDAAGTELATYERG